MSAEAVKVEMSVRDSIVVVRLEELEEHEWLEVRQVEPGRFAWCICDADHPFDHRGDWGCRTTFSTIVEALRGYAVGVWDMPNERPMLELCERLDGKESPRHARLRREERSPVVVEVESMPGH